MIFGIGHIEKPRATERNALRLVDAGPDGGPPSPEYAGTPLPTTVLRTPGCLVVTIEIGSRLDLTEILEDGIAHFNRPNSRTARALNIFGAIALFERAHDGLLNGRRFLLELEA